MAWWEVARATAGRPMRFDIWKALEVVGVGDRHVHEVIRLLEQPPDGDHLVEGHDGGLELLHRAPVVQRDLDGDDHLEAAPAAQGSGTAR
jgi:hypothetical protein